MSESKLASFFAGLESNFPLRRNPDCKHALVNFLINDYDVLAGFAGRICNHSMIVETGMWPDAVCLASTPMPSPAIPNVEQVGESIIEPV
jgi:hypothetical protein